MKKIFTCVFILLLQLSFKPIMAQTSNGNVNLYQVAGTKSPEVASLGKFGNVPVSYSTGVPSINIPIYEINIGELKVPVNLSYHAGGVRVDEMASSIGLGWALNAGGAISRSMIGLPDEGSGGYLLSPDFNTVTSATGATSLAFPYRYRSGTAEVTPDIFSYDVGNVHGKFIFRRTGNGKTFLELPMTNNRIERVASSDRGDDFKITDTKGIQYYFEEKESAFQGQGYIASWKLTKMVNSTLADTIYFSYESATAFYSTLFTNSTYIIGTTAYCGGKSPIFGGTRSTGSSTGGDSYLHEIKWRNGKITFNLSNDRLDYPGGRRVSGIDIYNFKNNSYHLLKQISLFHSHFTSVKDSRNLDVNDSRNFRLKLDSVFVKDANGLNAQPYRLTYNTSSMAPVGSFAQDMFGFNNGAFGNNDPFPLMKTYHTTSGVDGVESTIGSANRDVDQAMIKAGVLTSMSYPTGGKTTFDVEAHRFSTTGTNLNLVSQYSTSWISGGNGVLSNVSTFVFKEEMRSSLTIRASFSPYAGKANNPSYARIYDQTAQSQVVRINTIGYSTTGYEYSTSLYGTTGFPQLIDGHTYTLESYIFADEIGLSASITLGWTARDTSTVTLFKYGGGLRIKQITDYDRGNKFISSKTYTYGNKEDGTGILLTPPQYLGYNEESTIYRMGCSDSFSGGVDCKIFEGDKTYIIRQNSVLPFSQFSGSPVMYDYVTEYQVNENGNAGNGKSVFGYAITSDSNAFPTGDYKATGIALISNSWKNGYPAVEEHYKYENGSYKLVTNKKTVYNFHQKDSEPMIHIKSKYNYSGCGFTDQANVVYDFEISGYDIPSGVMQLDSSVNITYNNDGQLVKSRENYAYDNSNNYNLSAKETLLSDGRTLSENYLYPTDLSSSNTIYSQMVNRNIIEPVVKEERSINGNILMTKNTNYDSFQNGKVLAPKTVEVKNGNGPFEQRILVNGYDSFGNILDQQLINGIHNSYIWGYKSAFPIAEIRNAANSEVFLENFEENTSSTTGIGHTGNKYYSGSSYSLNWSLPNSRNYIVSYWYRLGGTWRFSGENVFSGSYNLSGGDAYDDILIQPSDAVVSTYTHEPSVGVTSQTDQKGMTIYYEYDDFQRLKMIKDQNGNIVKNYEYHYKP